MKTKNTKYLSTLTKGSAAIASTLVLSGALMSNTASADSCYIMVHGHGTQGNVQSGSSQPALDYWRESYFDEYQGSDFLAYLLDSPTDNYAIVGYDSTDESGYPYWRNETAGEIARQKKSI